MSTLLLNTRDNFPVGVRRVAWLNNFGEKICGICYYCQEPIFLPKLLWKYVFKTNFDKKGIEETLNKYIEEKKITHLESCHFDHFIADSIGGGNGIGNCLPICSVCNLYKSNTPSQKFVLDRDKRRKRKRDDEDLMDVDMDNERRCTTITDDTTKPRTRCQNEVIVFDKCACHIGHLKIYKVSFP